MIDRHRLVDVGVAIDRDRLVDVDRLVILDVAIGRHRLVDVGIGLVIVAGDRLVHPDIASVAGDRPVGPDIGVVAGRLVDGGGREILDAVVHLHRLVQVEIVVDRLAGRALRAPVAALLRMNHRRIVLDVQRRIGAEITLHIQRTAAAEIGRTLDIGGRVVLRMAKAIGVGARMLHLDRSDGRQLLHESGFVAGKPADRRAGTRRAAPCTDMGHAPRLCRDGSGHQAGAHQRGSQE